MLVEARHFKVKCNQMNYETNSWTICALQRTNLVFFHFDFCNRVPCTCQLLCFSFSIFINVIWMRNLYAVFAWAFAVCVANTLNTSEIIYFEPIFIECRCNKIVLVAGFSLSLCRIRAAYIMCIRLDWLRWFRPLFLFSSVKMMI